MTALYIILGIILAALGIIFFSTLKFEIEAFADLKGYFIHLKFKHLVILVETNKKKGQKSKVVTISVFGIKFHVNLNKFGKAKDKMEKDIDIPEEDAETTSYEALKAFIDIFSKIKEDLSHTFTYFSNKLVFHRLDTNIMVGFEDAAYTAVLTGICYAALSPILGFIFNHFRVDQTNTDVKACYNDNVFSIKTNVMLTLRPYCFIVLLFKILRVVYKIQKIYKKNKGAIENE